MWYVFQVVVKYIWWCCVKNIQCVIYMFMEVWYQCFYFYFWVFGMDGGDVVSKMLGVVVMQIVMVDRGDDYIVQCYVGDCLCQFLWFFCIWCNGVVMGDIIEWVVVSVNGVKDYKCSGIVVEIFSQVWVRCFFVDRMQVIFVYCGFDVLDMGRICWKFYFYLFWFMQQSVVFCDYIFNWDKSYFIGIVVFYIVFYYNGFIYSVCVLVVNNEGKCFNLRESCIY